MINNGNPLPPHSWVQHIDTSQRVRMCYTYSTQCIFVSPTPLDIKRKHSYLDTAEFCKLLKSALNLCALYFCPFVLNCIHLMWFLHIGIFVAVWKNVSWEGCDPYYPGCLDSNEKHSGDFGELVQKLLLGGVEVVEQWTFSVICSCVCVCRSYHPLILFSKARSISNPCQASRYVWPSSVSVLF